MNLFDTIGLKADPFSTSPNVDLFYPAVEHRQCLEGLELAIRMRRGLSVVKGGIGVGKTTISRKLIQNFSQDAEDFSFHLILDPKFESEIILLKHIIELFGINESAESVQDCRNIIENYLLKVGVDQGKTLVLIVDEGQNLPGKMLDVFRTLLNFETDEYKLLQLIIFGQPEMDKIIKEYPNFEDRIIFNFELGPITLEDTKGMIDHRIEVTGGKAQNWFSNEAIVKIYKNTQGYPRKITQLCHQALLAMMSEKQDIISEEMIQRVISGKIDTGGLLKQKKKNYNKIAVNKLLDVLQKDENKKSEDKDINTEESDHDDDWIGGKEDNTIKIAKQNKVKTQELNEKPSVQKIIRNQKVVEGVEDTKNENKPKTIQHKEQTSKIENHTADIDFLPNNGRYNNNIKQNILNKLPLDHLYIGLHIDSYHIATVAIEERKGIKTLLCHDIFSKESQDFTYPNNFESLMDSFPEISDRLISQISKYGDIYQSAIEVLEKKATIALTIDNDEISTHIITVPSQNAKEKNQIIEFSISKTINFPIDDAEVSHYKGNNELYYASVGSKNKLQIFGDYFFQNKWGIRKWYPVNQSIKNAFLWNYPDRNKASTLIIHIGEKNGSVLGFNKTDLTIIRPLYIGIATLFDTLRDNGVYDNRKEEQHRKLLQVPAPLLQTISKSIDKGEYDDIFRLVFEDWSQEIDRTINSMKKDVNISDETEILLAGSAGYIQYFDEFIQLETNIKTKFFNPIRNLAVAPEFSIESLRFNPSIFTASIGAGINIKNAASILPKNLKQEENLRWINRGGIALAAISLVFCIIFSINKKVNVEWLKFEIDPMQIEKNSLGYVQDKHSQLSENKGNVKDQLKILSYDTRYSDRILAINRMLSFYTPKEIKISELSFQNGWSVEAYKKMGRDLVPIVKKEDEHLRIVRLAGSVYANPALLESHFNNFITMLEETNIFQNIQIMNETSKANLGSDKLQFELKCVL